jgi:UDP-GlcNAc:undecaprenyl-phosphate GlcNAc-1-phosphate transferase
VVQGKIKELSDCVPPLPLTLIITFVVNMDSLIVEVIFVFVTAVGFQYLLPIAFKGLGQRKELAPERFRWAQASKPLTGGLGMFIPILLIYGVRWVTRQEIPVLLPFLTAALIVGLLDDWFSLSPIPKLAGQFLCGLLAWYSGLQIEWTHMPYLDLILTCVLLSALMNSINMLDNMDAVAGFAVLSSILPWLSVSNGILPHDFWWICSGILGFLLLNYHPSKVFMGDSGSHLLGAILFWFVTIQIKSDIGTSYSIWGATLLVISLLFFPLTDTLVVTISRIIRKQSPLIGGRDHLSHLLVKGGLSQAAVAWLIGLVNLLIGLVVRYWRPSPVVLVTAIFLLFLGFSLWYFRIFRTNRV